MGNGEYQCSNSASKQGYVDVTDTVDHPLSFITCTFRRCWFYIIPIRTKLIVTLKM